MTYPRRILLAVTGLSPQVVTETLYALGVAAGQGGADALMPTEVHMPKKSGHGAGPEKLKRKIYEKELRELQVERLVGRAGRTDQRDRVAGIECGGQQALARRGREGMLAGRQRQHQ